MEQTKKSRLTFPKVGIFSRHSGFLCNCRTDCPLIWLRYEQPNTYPTWSVITIITYCLMNYYLYILASFWINTQEPIFNFLNKEQILSWLPNFIITLLRSAQSVLWLIFFSVLSYSDKVKIQFRSVMHAKLTETIIYKTFKIDGKTSPYCEWFCWRITKIR